ncbi:C17h6orf52 [Phodopus roborovskii]|uniref:C17h6orf52 protein n=1 Tax=Phodopus roborovskii TaxID=109678 RepID=A0AAU9ZPY9_PHORO|nr:C17h6orf52 [Phodopus roborovskii]
MHSFTHLSCHLNGFTLNGNGPSPLAVYENPEPLTGPWAIPEETTAPAGNQDEELLEDPNLHLDIKESNKGFMAESKELYDSLMSCHWHPLDTTLFNIPDEPHPTPPIMVVTGLQEGVFRLNQKDHPRI